MLNIKCPNLVFGIILNHIHFLNYQINKKIIYFKLYFKILSA